MQCTHVFPYVPIACMYCVAGEDLCICAWFVLRQRRQRREESEEVNQAIPQPVRTQGHPGFIPVRFMILVNLIKRNFPPTRPMHYYNVDAFAGKAAISRAFRYRGLPSIALDLAINPNDESRLVQLGFIFRQHVSHEVVLRQ